MAIRFVTFEDEEQLKSSSEVYLLWITMVTTNNPYGCTTLLICCS
jgi:hypothetical protein